MNCRKKSLWFGAFYIQMEMCSSYRLPRKVTSQLALSHKFRDKSRLPGGIRRSPPLQFVSEMLPHPHRAATWRCSLCTRIFTWVGVILAAEGWTQSGCPLEERVGSSGDTWCCGYSQQLKAPDDLWTLSEWAQS